MIRKTHFYQEVLSNPKGWPGFLVFLALVILAGALISVVPVSLFQQVGIIGVTGYIGLAFVQPFAAFVVLVFFALTVWLSSVKVVGDVSILVGLGLIFTMVWLSRLLLRQETWVKFREFSLLLGLTAVVIVSALFNQGGPTGFSSVATYLQLILLLVLVVNMTRTPLRLHVLGGAIIASSTILAVMILMDHFGWLPISLMMTQTAGVYSSGVKELISRTGGLWGDANFTSLQLTIALPFIIEWWPITHGWWKRGLLLMMAAAILGAFSLTFSVGGLLGLVVVLMVKAIGSLRRDLLLSITRTVLLMVITYWVLLVMLPDLYLQRIRMKLDVISKAVSTLDRGLLLQIGSDRGDTWQAAVRAIGDSPLIGHGPGNAAFVNPQYSVFYSNARMIGSHNMFLTVGVDLGLVGMALFIGLLILAVMAVRRSPQFRTGNSTLQRDGNALFIALLAYIAQGLAIDIQTMKLLWILLGMAIAYKQLIQSDIPETHASRVT